MRIKWKPGRPLPTFDHTITVLNKLAARDSPTKLDLWKKTIIPNCAWTAQSVRSAAGAEISIGGAFVVRVPETEHYRPYHNWKESLEGVTFSTGDYIIKGEVEEEVTAQNVQNVVNRHRPEAFELRYFRDNTGAAKGLGHYHLEGT